ncbi:MAG: hypothetical protein AW09_000181 [Candidatus Accumulibacter phosphatis]|uniref:Uncharacterized protein n=1 Tax=Candidatus Accumulibacter phosphatis TaxID=327160 RepID=A0A080M2G4_9PROT|nr:MAG: hypothetical protein AW09_000181 [Candidatus Accumulibacter phosphatis]
MLAECVVLDQFDVSSGDAEVGLGEDHVQIRQQCGEERPLRVHFPQQRQAGITLTILAAEVGVDRRPEAAPARQGDPALSPAEAPGNRPQVLDGVACLAGGGAGADVQLGDFADRRGAEEVVGEAGCFVHELSISRHAGHAQSLGGGQKARRCPPGRR